MKKKKWIGAIFLVLAVVCAGVGILQLLRELWAGNEYDKLREQLTISTTEAPTQAPTEAPTEAPTATPTPTPLVISAQEATPLPTPTPTPEPTPEPVPIDFATLQSRYPDAYAWIHIEDTKIDYPIMQSSGDQTYYLTHTIDGDVRTEGSIYTENLNSKDFSDPMTVIYGHNMRNGSMFQNLHKFEDRSFFNEHNEILIYTPEKVLHYRVFAAYTADDSHILRKNDFSDTNIFTLYINSVLNQRSMSANIDSSLDITAQDKLITLSTCNGNSSERYVVQAVLLPLKSNQSS